MRVTRGMLMNNILQNLRRSNSQITRYQTQIASGKRINTASDDPIGTSLSLRLRSVLAQNQQYTDNSGEGIAWLDQTETALGEISDILNEARELAIYGAGGTLPQESMDALAEKADQLLGHLLQVGNTTFGDRYIFAGQDTRIRPFAFDSDPAAPPSAPGGVLYNGDDGAIFLEISWGAGLEINVTGQKAFVDTGVFAALKALSDNLRSGDTAALGSAVLADIGSAVDKTLALRAEVGAKSNRLELNQNRLSDNSISMIKLLSQAEDADIPEVAMYLSNMQYTYQAALAVGARILPMTLVDFLR